MSSRMGLGKGPSPRARGALSEGILLMEPEGTIPACEGSTIAIQPAQMHSGDHPRVRGEHAALAALVSITAGPSPRARGALVALQHARLDERTIPACEGSTLADLHVYSWRRQFSSSCRDLDIPDIVFVAGQLAVQPEAG